MSFPTVLRGTKKTSDPYRPSPWRNKPLMLPPTFKSCGGSSGSTDTSYLTTPTTLGVSLNIHPYTYRCLLHASYLNVFGKFGTSTRRTTTRFGLYNKRPVSGFHSSDGPAHGHFTKWNAPAHELVTYSPIISYIDLPTKPMYGTQPSYLPRYFSLIFG